MGLATAALLSGRNALLTYQGALQVVGNNVANVGNADYTRQSARLAAVPGGLISPGMQPGAGVTITSIQRHVDEALENRLRISNGDLQSAQVLSENIASIETLFDDASGAGLSSRITAFFNAMSDVQNSPDDLGIRTVAISSGQTMAQGLQNARQSLLQLGLETNDSVRSLVDDANRMAGQIAELNRNIVQAEVGAQGQASSLRDRRDALLRDLSDIFNVSSREQPDGSIIVYVGSEPLVQGGSSRGLTTVDQSDGDYIRTTVRFADSNSPVNAAGGRIAGLITAREEQALGRIDALDRLAAAIIADVNAVHADGQGLQPFTSVTAANSVADPAAALNSSDAGLRNPPVNGSFFITVTDEATGTPVAYRIPVDLDGAGTDTSLNDLVTSINGTVQGVTAAITTDGRLTLTADSGLAFTFGHDGDQIRADNARLLAALGINTLFEGSGAADIAVRQDLIADPSLLAAATVNAVGDGNNAGRIAGLVDSPSEGLGAASVLDFYNTLANGIAADGAAAKDAAEGAEAINSALRTQREAVSGVSLDEEAINLMKFERAFQGAARYVSVVDQMMQEMMNLVS